MHPGYVSTDMTIYSGMLTPEEGGSRVVAAAPATVAGPTTGAYFAERKVVSFV
ncbi:hypothetical protein ACP4OV_007952 [Aristida adscensionis]